MSDPVYTPPKVWQWQEGNGGKFASINRPVAGATYEQQRPLGEHPLQLYSLATPNGVKVTIMLEELLQAGIREAEYDAWLVNILEGEQFSSGFVEVNPNSKIPALMDHSVNPPVRLFESGSILLYLADKFQAFIPQQSAERAECLNWLFWQMGSAPMLGGGFGHFYAYAPEKYEYPINRYTMEIKRQLDVLNQHLATREFICGEQYTIADMAIYPWYGVLVQGGLYEAAEFIEAHTYTHVLRWADALAERPAVKRGRLVNRTWGEVQLAERHSASDIDAVLEDQTM
ncbi:glutathione-dependent disulfide-bond oxidoreductase [Thalassolituus marinus]|uniref:Glutathione-dependent disulfide-bond oxidoreductase n=1 Tax=Thalassolituus marinus TaxID=671053 RepID=A0ABS7ZPC5_9GAMM|nr:glutathione-dependent disulfide-bond oxidoreductase [Thalassolituus marinus]MCA6063559.1 glutathione-dependent disulfide-bond oxidoreductase [Thalassolituus marinus]